VIVFYGKFSLAAKTYSSGPYANSGEFDRRIRNLLTKTGYKTG